jgi:hypothetical protein
MDLEAPEHIDLKTAGGRSRSTGWCGRLLLRHFGMSWRYVHNGLGPWFGSTVAATLAGTVGRQSILSALLLKYLLPLGFS